MLEAWKPAPVSCRRCDCSVSSALVGLSPQRRAVKSKAVLPGLGLLRAALRLSVYQTKYKRLLNEWTLFLFHLFYFMCLVKNALKMWGLWGTK